MEKKEFKARIDAKTDEAKRDLDAMKAKAAAATGDAKVAYTEQVAALQTRYDELKAKAAAAWDAADDKWEAKAKDVEAGWDDWSGRAKKAWKVLTK